MMKKKVNLPAKAKYIRAKTLKLLYQAGAGHLGSAMSTVELLTALYFGEVLNYRTDDPDWSERDFFLLSNGHACPTLYVALALAGFFPESRLDLGYFSSESGLEGHPVKGCLPGIEISSGSLGMGLAVGVGLALGLRLNGQRNRVIVMMSDGEQQEGAVWEAVMAAAHYRLNNLTAIIDRNGIQIGGKTEENMSLEPLAKKYQSFGWQVVTIDGHNFRQIKKAFDWRTKSAPIVVLARTVPAKGVVGLEGRSDTHHPPLSNQVYQQSIERLK